MDVNVGLYVISKILFCMEQRVQYLKRYGMDENRSRLVSAERFGEGKLHTVSSILCS